MVNYNFIDPSLNEAWYFLSFRKGSSISFQLAHYYLKLDDLSMNFYLPKDISNSSTKAWVATDISQNTRNNPINPLDISNNIFSDMLEYSKFKNENWHRIDITIDLPFDLASWVLIDGITTRSGNYKLIFDESPDVGADTDFQFKLLEDKKKRFPWFTVNGDYKDIVENIADKIKGVFSDITDDDQRIYIPFGLAYDSQYSTSNKIKYIQVTKDNRNELDKDIDFEFGYAGNIFQGHKHQLFSIDINSYN